MYSFIKKKEQRPEKSVPFFKVNFTILIIVFALIFTFAFKQSPLFTTNQHTKFLHGLAHAGYGHLNEDWQANTKNGLPAFTALVYVTYKISNRYMFYVYRVLFFILFFFLCYAIGERLFLIKASYQARICFALSICFIFSHFFSDIFRWDAWGGAAGQYIPSYFQPSFFGVFILLSFYLFLKKKYSWALLSTSISALFHPAYLLSAVVINLTYFFVFYKEKLLDWKILSFFLISLLVIISTPVYMAIIFAPTTPEMFALSKEILAFTRIPHHSKVEIWFSGIIPWLQVLILLLSLWLIRKSKLMIVLATCSVVGILLTAAQYFIKDAGLALLAPWRISVFLYPLSIIILLSYIFKKWFSKTRQGQNISVIICGVIVLASVFYSGYGYYAYYKGTINNIFKHYLSLEKKGVKVKHKEIALKNNTDKKKKKSDNLSVLDYIRKNGRSGQVYLTHAKMHNFRLDSGMPQFVSWKSHPYKDVEVLEWHKRINFVNSIFDEDLFNCEIFQKMLKEYKITHLLINKKKTKEPACSNLQLIKTDGNYNLYKVNI